MTDILAILAALGFGGIIGSYFSAHFQRRAEVGQKQHEIKQTRYLCIVLLMHAKLSPDSEFAKLRQRRPDIEDRAALDRELHTELMNGYIFASDAVLRSLAKFIALPSRSSFVRAVEAMRKDLWGRRTALEEALLENLPDRLTSA